LKAVPTVRCACEMAYDNDITTDMGLLIAGMRALDEPHLICICCILLQSLEECRSRQMRLDPGHMDQQEHEERDKCRALPSVPTRGEWSLHSRRSRGRPASVRPLHSAQQTRTQRDQQSIPSLRVSTY